MTDIPRSPAACAHEQDESARDADQVFEESCWLLCRPVHGAGPAVRAAMGVAPELTGGVGGIQPGERGAPDRHSSRPGSLACQGCIREAPAEQGSGRRRDPPAVVVVPCLPELQRGPCPCEEAARSAKIRLLRGSFVPAIGRSVARSSGTDSERVPAYETRHPFSPLLAPGESGIAVAGLGGLACGSCPERSIPWSIFDLRGSCRSPIQGADSTLLGPMTTPLSLVAQRDTACVMWCNLRRTSPQDRSRPLGPE